jgi:hypothetical protein
VSFSSQNCSSSARFAAVPAPNRRVCSGSLASCRQRAGRVVIRFSSGGHAPGSTHLWEGTDVKLNCAMMLRGNYTTGSDEARVSMPFVMF